MSRYYTAKAEEMKAKAYAKGQKHGAITGNAQDTVIRGAVIATVVATGYTNGLVKSHFSKR
jgi:hypothetical protein